MTDQLSRQGSSKPAPSAKAAAVSSSAAELAALAASGHNPEASSKAGVATLTALLEAHAVREAWAQRQLDQIQSAPAAATQPDSDAYSAAACTERQQAKPVDGVPQSLHSSLPLMKSSSGQLLALRRELEQVPATSQDRRPPAPSQAPSDQQAPDGQLSSANHSVPADSQSTTKSIESRQGSSSPVFVPIVLAMEESDHRVLIQEWHARQLVSAAVLVCTVSVPRCRGGMLVCAQWCAASVPAAMDWGVFLAAEGVFLCLQNGCSSPDYPESVYERLHSLQDRLCRYAQRNVPVVHVSIASFPTVLDKLHDYLLKCIEVAMQGG